MKLRLLIQLRDFIIARETYWFIFSTANFIKIFVSSSHILMYGFLICSLLYLYLHNKVVKHWNERSQLYRKVIAIDVTLCYFIPNCFSKELIFIIHKLKVHDIFHHHQREKVLAKSRKKLSLFFVCSIESFCV